MMGNQRQSSSSSTSHAVSIARDNHDVYTTSNVMPWRFSSRPAAMASFRPSSDSGTSSQPVNMPSLLYSFTTQ